MTNEEKKALYECSIEGFIKEFRSTNHRNLEDAVANSMLYLTKYGIDEKSTTCDLEELIYTIRNELAIYVAKYQLESDPNDLTDLHAGDDNPVFQQFIKDPINFLRVSVESMGKVPYDPENQDEDYKKYTDLVNKNIDTLVALLKSADTKRNFEVYERDKNDTKYVISSLDDYFSNDDEVNGIEQSFAKQKAGFFEGLFGTTSKEYKDFKIAFDNYRNIDHQLHGDKEALENAAMNYLKHKFPNLKDDKLPTMEQISKLSGAGKERAKFCLKTIESLRLQAQANKMVDAVKKIDMKLPTDEEIENFKSQVNINEEYKDPLIVEDINKEYEGVIENINEEYVGAVVVEDINKINDDFQEKLKNDSNDVSEENKDNLDDDAPDMNKVELYNSK